MKRIFVCLAVYALFSGIICGQEVRYRFSPDRPLTYNFNMDGDVSYNYEGMDEEKFKVSSKGTVTLETLEVKENSYRVKLTPSKTFLEFNNMVLEDITAQDTARSQMISTAVIEIAKNGEVLSTKEISSGILNFAQILTMMPVFPEKLSSKPWKQSVPSFSLPGIPMCGLEFIYQYNKGTEALSGISFMSNQRINEKRKDGEGEIHFTGLNSSTGGFTFDESLGEIKNFKGIIKLILKASFRTPPAAGKEVPAVQTPPLNMEIRLNVNLSAADR